ncbi:MAG: ankyrin repeat domain-containing protein [Acidobacteriota bacterium]|nr:ankyrin repeat domain-containing protein [Blastocatellia bacterium]MDW8411159.1 ankyrin repeat domain-containing protein [Acidobacteriota bacterium]
MTTATLLGQILEGKYHIEKLLGSGGMGAVYLATHLGTERSVAIKVMIQERTSDIYFLERFRREAVAAGKLCHPNIVNVTDFGIAELDGTQIAYLVMEYLHGYSLKELLKRRGKLPVSLTIDLLEQICAALCAAHRLGVIHRDIKPDNIFLQPNGRGGFTVKVLDFGLAKIQQQGLHTKPLIEQPSKAALSSRTEEQATLLIGQVANSELDSTVRSQEVDTVVSNPTSDTLKSNTPRSTGSLQRLYESQPDSQITQQGVIMGTPLYMSPEQWQGLPVDYRSDIYSLGIVAYQMLSGRLPFTGDLADVLEGHVRKTPASLEQLCPEVGSDLAAVIMKALSKDPAHRPATAHSFLLELRANFEGTLPLFREAVDKCRDNFTQILSISAAIYAPYILVGAGFVAITRASPSSSSDHAWICALGLLLLAALANRLTAAAFVLPTARLRVTKTINVISSIRHFYSLYPNLLLTTLKWVVLEMKAFTKWRSKRLTPYALFHATVAYEGLSGEEALRRSAYLEAGMPGPSLAITLRSLFLSLLTVTLGPIVVVSAGLISSMFGSNLLQFLPDRHGLIPYYITIPFCYMTPWVLLVSLHSYISIASALHYFRTREIVGEEPETEVLSEELQSKTKRHSSTIRIIVPTLMLTIIVISWHFALDKLLLYVSTNALTPAVEALILAGADPNASVRPETATEFETTPLLNAIIYGANTELLELLIKHGADPNLANSYKWTPLHEAVNQGNIEAVELLLRHGADPNKKNNPGWTPLMHAARTGRLRILRLLVRNGALVNLVNADGDSALSIAVMYGQAYAIAPLLELGAEVNIQNKQGITPLMYAAEGGDSYIVRLLLEKGADVDIKDKLGRTAADYTTEEDILQLLKQGENR